MKLPPPPIDTEIQPLLEEVVGYVNFSSGTHFSSGTSDPKFLENLNLIIRNITDSMLDHDRGAQDRGAQDRDDESLAIDGAPSPGPNIVQILCHWIESTIDRLESQGGPFAETRQARGVLHLLEHSFLPAYRKFHGDLLHHQTEASLWRPFFLGMALEGLLAQGPPWDETDRIIDQTLQQLNDYVGYRPIATLESQPNSQPYAHEFVRPITLYIPGAGVAVGPYEPIIQLAINILHATDPDILARACFDLEQLQEISLDPRAYDFDHPVGRRPNFQFGQWDPHQISKDGYYSRFVLQQGTLDALLARVSSAREKPESEEYLLEAAAVLAGTMLMASGTCGDGPGCHDSDVTLSVLLPRIASYRDDFYQQLLRKTDGAHSDRLRHEAQEHHQPFGGARQHLNHKLAHCRARQLERVHLAHLFARMGHPDSAMQRVDSVRVPAARMICKIYCHLTSAHHCVDKGRLEEVPTHLE